mgnify:CR=1 FL=1
MEKSSNSILIDPQTFAKIFKDTNIIVDENSQYPVALLEFILNDDQAYNALYNIFKSDYKFHIKPNTNQDEETHDYEKIPFLLAVDTAKSEGLLELDTPKLKRYKALINLISYKNLKKTYENKSIETRVEGVLYKVQISDIFKLLELSEEDLNYYLSLPNPKNRITKEAFLYIVKKFIIRQELEENYILPEHIEDRIASIVKYEIYDFEAQNTYLSDENSLTSETTISPELKHALIKDMPENYSLLEQAIYIYIKMCQILSYNDEFFAAKQRGLPAKKHQMIDYVETITPGSPEVVCYEFNVIYAKMLHSLGINFQRECFNWKNKYGSGHENLSFRVGKYIIEADSAKKILTGDLFSAKIGTSIKGLKCRNQNFDSQLEFDTILRKVYTDIKKEDKTTFSNALKEYEELTNKRKVNIPFKARFELFLEKIKNSTFTGITIMAYIIRLVNILFTDEEKNQYIDFEIIRDNNPEDDDKMVATCGIITMNENGIIKDEEHNKYYIYINGELKRIPKKTLIQSIITNNLGFIDSEKQYIPGIR